MAAGGSDRLAEGGTQGAFVGLAQLAGEVLPDRPQVGRDGGAQPLPPEAAPNGITLGPDGDVYVADSLLGRVWRVPAGGGDAVVWVENDLLAPRPFLAAGGSLVQRPRGRGPGVVPLP